MELLIGLLLEFLFEVVFAGLIAGVEYGFARTGKRFWMWALGAAVISFVVWWRGPALWTTWAIAGSWLALLVFLDSRITSRTQKLKEPGINS
jgi:Flp pilus assembly protein TadB